MFNELPVWAKGGRHLHGLSFSLSACEDGYRLENETCMR